ncbi:hypothetical protein BWI17_14815 [Betaproteobacteria bacterium GR16-43]|nr:hypothetical protein BWI17_14815 [Betaproteobacteria bacterium GR16-43]
MKKTHSKGWIAFAAVLGVLLGGCQPTAKEDNEGNLRVVHAVLDAEALNVVVKDDSKATGLSLGNVSSYVSVAKGSLTTDVKSSTNGTLLLERAISYTNGDQTLALYGKRGAMQAVLLSDETSDPSSGKFKVRALGLSPDAGIVDVYLTNADLSTVPANFTNIAYASSTDFIELAEGDARFVFTAAGTKDVLFESPTQRYAAGGKYTLGVFPTTGGKLVNALQVTSGSGAGGSVLSNTKARVKAVNADPASAGYNFLAGGAPLLSNVPYKGASSYVTTGAGTPLLTLEAANVPGTAVASSSQALGAAQDFSLVAVSNAGTTQLVALADNNNLPTTGKAKVRFVNALSGTAADALVDFATQASGIAFRSASGYVEFVPGDSYTVTFTTPGGVTALATLTSVQWVSAGVYTVYLFGIAGGAMEARLVRDR